MRDFVASNLSGDNLASFCLNGIHKKEQRSQSFDYVYIYRVGTWRVNAHDD